MNEIKVNSAPKNSLTHNDIQKLLKLANGVSFGSITLFIQDGKAIQIEKHEKMRLR